MTLFFQIFVQKQAANYYFKQVHIIIMKFSNRMLVAFAVIISIQVELCHVVVSFHGSRPFRPLRFGVAPPSFALSLPMQTKTQQQQRMQKRKFLSTALFAKKKPSKAANAKLAALEALEALEVAENKPVQVAEILDQPLSKKEELELKKKQERELKKQQQAAKAEQAAAAAEHQKNKRAEMLGANNDGVVTKNGSDAAVKPAEKPMSKKDKMLAKALEMDALDAADSQATGDDDAVDDDEPKLSKKELKALKLKEEKLAAKAAAKAEKKTNKLAELEEADVADDDNDQAGVSQIHSCCKVVILFVFM